MARCLSRCIISRLRLQRCVTRKIIAEHPDKGRLRNKDPEHVKRNRAEERACADQCIGFRLTCHLGVLLRAVLSQTEVLRKGSEHFGPSFLDADAPIISWEAAAHDPCAVLPDLACEDPDSEPQKSGKRWQWG